MPKSDAVHLNKDTKVVVNEREHIEKVPNSHSIHHLVATNNNNDSPSPFAPKLSTAVDATSSPQPPTPPLAPMALFNSARANLMMTSKPMLQHSFTQTLMALSNNAMNRPSFFPMLDSSYKQYLDNYFAPRPMFPSHFPTHPAFKGYMPLCGCCGSRGPCTSILAGHETRTSSVAELRRRAREHSEAMTSSDPGSPLHRS
ncbi:hypothetical protein DPMN_026566 [Dreissena polymorpha]|uniref:OAR domain-containing protein n=2 Tax=Dreissena polymorpha TaxID=45954 RepID=A0A9D4LVF6_DREPO|nr:hypothetical protein DPMN_026566 [Dreissena polymorpha]